jgi:hypothetical protein
MPEIERLQKKIQYSFEETPNGGCVVIFLRLKPSTDSCAFKSRSTRGAKAIGKAAGYVPLLFHYQYQEEGESSGTDGFGPADDDNHGLSARRLLAAGVPQVVARELTGHRTSAMFDRYAIVSSTDMLAAQKKVELFRKQA